MLPAVSHEQRTGSHSLLSPYSPKASDHVRPLLVGWCPFWKHLVRELEGSLTPDKNAPNMCFPDHHTTLTKWLVFWAVSTLQVLFLCIYLPLASLTKNVIFIIIGTGAIWMASKLRICTLWNQVGRLSKLILQRAGVLKALFAWRSEEVGMYFFFFKCLHYLES